MVVSERERTDSERQGGREGEEEEERRGGGGGGTRNTIEDGTDNKTTKKNLNRKRFETHKDINLTHNVHTFTHESELPGTWRSREETERIHTQSTSISDY